MTDETAVIDKPAETISLRDELASAVQALRPTDEKPAASEPIPPAEPTAAERARDDQGRFAKAEAEKKQRETIKMPAKEGAPAAATTTLSADTSKPVMASPKAPDGWNAAAKAKFATLDPEIQAEVLRRETDMHKQFTTQDADRSLGKGIREVAQPYLATIKAEGGDEKTAFGMFLNYAHIMRFGTPQQKQMALRSVVQQYNVDLGQPVQQGQLSPQLESLQQRIDRMEQERQAEVQQRQFQEQSELQGQIAAFSVESGHEHFETVKTLMGSLLESGQAKDLQDAYDKAIWANPDIRSTLSAQITRDAEEKRLSEAKDKADAAKKASGSLAGGPGGVRPTNGAGGPTQSLSDEIRASLRAAQGRI